MSSFGTTIISRQYRVEGRPVSDADILDYMRAQGMDHVPESLVYDGRLHRFATDLSKKGDDAGWYSADIINGNIRLVFFGDWRKGLKGRFARGDRDTVSENDRLEMEYRIEQHRIQEEAERRRMQAERATEAKRLWDSYPDASQDIPYVARKGIFPHETKTDGEGRLVVPVYGEDGEIRSLQYIPENGKEKRFLWGTSVKGCFWWLGDPSSQRVFLCEGFATAASINEATGACVFMAFMASALPDTARMLRSHGKGVTVVADNDKAGIEWADRCEDCNVVVIPQEGEDANDYQLRTGALKDILPNLTVTSRMLMADDMVSENLMMRWFIKGWIPEGSIGMIHGPSASGKTNIVMDMMLSASSGMGQWHGNRIRRPMNVVYLCGEGLFGVKMRMKAWKTHYGMERLGNFAVYPLPLDLDKPEGVHEIREQVDTLPWKPDLIIVDTVNRYMSGDENSAQDTRMFLNCVDTLRSAYSCSGLYVHHTGNSDDAQKRARGSSAWKGALDFEISVSVADDGRTRVIEQVKMKDAELLEPMYGTITGEPIDVYDDEGEQSTGAVFDVCGEPVSESDAKLEEAMSLLLSAYVESGRSDNRISYGYLKNWLIESQQVTRKTAEKMMNPNEGNRFIGRLVRSGSVTKEGDGFYIRPCMETGLINRMSRGKQLNSLLNGDNGDKVETSTVVSTGSRGD